MKNIYMIGNTHFDPVWTWTWEEGLTSIHSTFRSALDRLKEDKDCIYSFSSPPVFEWLEIVDPQMLEEIKERVKEGRWEISEGWWTQPDCFSASGEGYARQSLYGQLYLKKTFGEYAKIVYDIDSFGHNSQSPQILKKSHMEYYCMYRPEKNFRPLKSPYFTWEGKDKTCIKAFCAGRYSSIYNKDIYQNVAEAESLMKDAECDEMMIYGITNHGGAPTKKAIADIHAIAAEKDYEVKFSSIEGYFKAQGEPKYIESGEFLTDNFGPYVDDRKVKTLNRLAEYAVTNAEKVSLITEKLLGIPYNAEKLARCWKDILFNHFHDTLGGASTKEVYRDAYRQLDRAIFTSSEIVNLNLLALTKKIKTPGKNPENPWNLAVWNLNEIAYDGYLEGEVQWLHEFPAYTDGIVLEDDQGKRYPCQTINEKSAIKGFRSRVLFKAQIPAMGYKLFKVIQEGAGVQPVVHSNNVETDVFKIEINEKTGLIDKIIDKTTGKEYHSLLTPQCFVDEADSECFNTQTYGEALEPFKIESLETIESGLLRTTLKAVFSFRRSLLTLYYVFYKDTDYFDVKYVVNWNEKHIVFKLLMKTNYQKLMVASPFASEERPDYPTDRPTGEWLSVYGDDGAVSLAFDSTFAYNKEGTTVGLSILRSCIYGDYRFDDSAIPERDYDIMEQGIGEGRIRFIIHSGDRITRGVVNEARLFNNAPIVLCEPNHDGVYPAEGSYASIIGDSVSVSAVKKAENGDGDIVRIVELAGREQKAVFNFFDMKFDVDLKPYEIKTLKIKDGKAREVYITED